MPNLSARPLRTALMLGALVLLLVSATPAIATLQRLNNPEALFLAALERWDARPFNGYHLVLSNDKGSCVQDVAVQAEQVIKRFENTCRVPARTISDLFRLISGTRSAVYRCVSLGCACDTVLTASIRYHPQLGYPTRISLDWAVRPNLYHFDYWQHLARNASLPRCPGTSYSRTVTVETLTPLP